MSWQRPSSTNSINGDGVANRGASNSERILRKPDSVFETRVNSLMIVLPEWPDTYDSSKNSAASNA